MKPGNAVVVSTLLAGCGPQHASYDIWPEPEETVREQSGISVRAYPVGDFNNRLAFEIDLKGRGLAGVSLAFQGEIITLWVRGNKIGKLKQANEETSREQRDILFAVSVMALIAIMGWLIE